MTKPGPKPKPTAIKRLAGNPGKRPLSDSEPAPAAAAPPIPRGLLDREGRKMWRYLIPILSRLRVMTEADYYHMIAMCMHYSVMVMAWRKIKGGNIEASGSRSQPVKEPAVGVLSESSRLFSHYAEQFGLSPSSRFRIQVPPIEDDRSLAEILFDSKDQDGGQ